MLDYSAREEALSCEECTTYDLIVIGAGPHALALVTRLLERYPSSLISDDEHVRLHQLHTGKHHRDRAVLRKGMPVSGPTKTTHRSYKHEPVSALNLSDGTSLDKRVLVIDKFGQWMGRWDSSFSAYNIEHLRSPLFFHIDPSHADGLQLQALQEREEREVRPAHEQSEPEGPGAFLHARDGFCEELVRRYKLHDMVVQGICTSVDTVETDEGTVFKVVYECTDAECATSVTLYSKAVVTAIGNTNIPRIPPFVTNIKNPYPSSSIIHAYEFIDDKAGGDADSADSSDKVEKSRLHKIKAPQNPSARTILIVGGGLTSAQMVDMAISRGFKNVVLVMRSKIKIRQFDFSLDLMGRNASRWYARFWMEDEPRARLRMIRTERRGGSITPEYVKRLKQLVSEGFLTIRENVSVESCEWVSSSDTDGHQAVGEWRVQLSDSHEPMCNIAQIWLATGGEFNVYKEPVYKTIVRKHRVEIVEGLPVLTNDMQLHKDLPFFVMSGYSALAVGPVAANLQGGRVGAERIAVKLWELWHTEGELRGEPVQSRGDNVQLGSETKWTMEHVTANMCNYFSALVDEVV
ncbi:hypothetical protein BJ742DRAFT_893839 [Cladochytrium replicatum]|nr:hypothetical protein BJ742DRAFT_893839 [Cladochytrium replicatum]